MPDHLTTPDRDLLIELKVLLGELIKRVDGNQVTNLQWQAKFEQRLSIIEQWRQNLNGRMTATAAIVSAVVGFAIQLTMTYISKQ